MRKGITVLLAQFVIVVVATAIWQTVGTVSEELRFLISTPLEIANELVKMIRSGDLGNAMLITGAEAATGLVIGTLLGSCCGLLLWYSEFVDKVARPFVFVAANIPVFAFAPLMIMWFGIGFSMKVALATFSTFFVSFAQAARGARSVSDEQLEVMAAFSASKRQIFSIVVVPGSIDWVLNSMRINVGLALLGAFIGEFISAQAGLGYIILRAGSVYNTGRALAAGIAVVALAFVFDLVAGFISKKRHRLVQLLSVPRLLRRRKSAQLN